MYSFLAAKPLRFYGCSRLLYTYAQQNHCTRLDSNQIHPLQITVYWNMRFTLYDPPLSSFSSFYFTDRSEKLTTRSEFVHYSLFTILYTHFELPEESTEVRICKGRCDVGDFPAPYSPLPYSSRGLKKSLHSLLAPIPLPGCDRGKKLRQSSPI